MGGTRGKGKASAAKSKGKAPSVVSAVPEPEPVVSEGSSECPSDGENKIEIPSTDEKENDDKKIEIPSTDEKENDDTTSELVAGDGSEDNEQLADEGSDEEKSNVEKNDLDNNGNEKNDDEKDVTDELITNKVDSVSEDYKELITNDDDDAASDVNSENDGVDTEEGNVEDLSDGGAGEDNEGKPDEEVEVKDKEPINDCGGNENIHTGEENNDTEVAEDGKMVTGEGLAASGHGLIDEMMSKEASDELNAEKPLEMAEEREDVSIANNVKASAEEAKKPKRKIIKKKVIKKVRKNYVASNNESTPQSAIINDASGDGNSAEADKHERNEEKTEIKQPVVVNKKLIKKRKSVVSENNAGVAASSDGQKAEPTNIELGSEVLKETDKLDVEGEKAEKLGKKASRLKKKRKQKVKKDETTGNVVTGDTNTPGPSQKGKSKKVDTMGMIFMCSSETKKDCYQYKVLGLPAGKKDFVSKIYKGMRLFLFDVKLRMLYGIYKAATPGGFNIEPRAFNSKFPSQVRFTVLEECVPLAEEKFKKVIKKNYYTKNKFNCKLTSVQVRELCKLFRETTKKADSTRIVRNPVEAAPSSAKRDNKRKRKRTEEGYKGRPASSSKRERRHIEREVRRGPVAVDDRYYQRPVHEREVYLPPPAPPVQVVYQALPPPSLPRPSSYSYGGPTRDDIYRRVPSLERVPVIERRELGLSSLGRPAEADRREPYASYRESRGAYLEPAYETGIRRDLYEASTRRDLYEPSARREHYDYTSDARRVEYYGAPDYRPPLPPYRRY